MKSHSRLFNKHLHPKKLQAAFLLTQGLFPLAEQFCFMHSFTTTGFLINTLVWIILQPWVLLLLRVDGFIQACVSGKQKKKKHTKWWNRPSAKPLPRMATVQSYVSNLCTGVCRALGTRKSDNQKIQKKVFNISLSQSRKPRKSRVEDRRDSWVQ